MRNIFTTVLLSFILNNVFGQAQRNFALYLEGQYTKTIQDYTIYNNPWSMGLGLQCFFYNKAKLKPTIDITGDAYLESYKVAYLDANGTIIDPVGGMVNTFAGLSFYPVKNIYTSLVAGPGFVSKQILFGLKPSIGFLFPDNQRWMSKFSYIHMFHRGKKVKEDFTSVSIAIAFRLY